jgi:peptide-methionine (R)-S-oxide reductase
MANWLSRVFRGGGEAEGGDFEIEHAEAEWREKLGAERFQVLRKHGTEAPFSSPLLAEKRLGTYDCAGCGLALYMSETKFDSRTGWPSFHAALPAAVGTSRDFKLIVPRTELHCARCGGHLGHVFPDGPPPNRRAPLHQRPGAQVHARPGVAWLIGRAHVGDGVAVQHAGIVGHPLELLAFLRGQDHRRRVVRFADRGQDDAMQARRDDRRTALAGRRGPVRRGTGDQAGQAQHENVSHGIQYHCRHLISKRENQVPLNRN